MASRYITIKYGDARSRSISVERDSSSRATSQVWLWLWPTNLMVNIRFTIAYHITQEEHQLPEPQLWEILPQELLHKYGYDQHISHNSCSHPSGSRQLIVLLKRSLSCQVAQHHPLQLVFWIILQHISRLQPGLLQSKNTLHLWERSWPCSINPRRLHHHQHVQFRQLDLPKEPFQGHGAGQVEILTFCLIFPFNKVYDFRL